MLLELSNSFCKRLRMSLGIRAFALSGLTGVTWSVTEPCRHRSTKACPSAIVIIGSERRDVTPARCTCCTGRAPGPWVQQSVFFPSRTVLISIYPGPPAKALCGRDSCICVIPSHCCSDLSLTWGPLDSSAFSSWPLSFQKLDSGPSFLILWVSRDRSPFPCAPQLVPAEDGLAPCPQAPVQEERAQHPVEPPYILVSFPSVSEIPFLRASRHCFALAVLLSWSCLDVPGLAAAFPRKSLRVPSR